MLVWVVAIGFNGIWQMTEAEWVACDNPAALLAQVSLADNARRLRLLICAYLRSQDVWPLLVSKCSRRAAEVSEAYADGQTDEKALALASKSAYGAWQRSSATDGACYYAAGLAYSACHQDKYLLGKWGGMWHLNTFIREAKLKPQAGVLRDVLGNPFLPAWSDAAWMTRTVSSVAKAAYEECALSAGTLDPIRLSILADAMEEAGAPDQLVTHLRSTGPHVRGCRVVDLCLGRS